ncbi:hypothetical protein RCO48_39685 [Peribacillus frigoritolerans]|nr:hypothetical protein [Peribacillus frigoritolerans]
MEGNGLEIPDFKFAEDTTIGAGEEVTNEFLKSKKPPTAIFACNDFISNRGYSSCKSAKCKKYLINYQLLVLTIP